MRRTIIGLALAALVAASSASATTRTTRAYFVMSLGATESLSPTVLCTGGELRARPQGACFDIADGETSVTITLADFTSDTPDVVYRFYDDGLERVPSSGSKICDASGTVAIPAGATHLVVIPAAHLYRVGSNQCRPHGETDVVGAAGMITATFS